MTVGVMVVVERGTLKVARDRSYSLLVRLTRTIMFSYTNRNVETSDPFDPSYVTGFGTVLVSASALQKGTMLG